jgi:hypothetical protein
MLLRDCALLLNDNDNDNDDDDDVRRRALR